MAARSRNAEKQRMKKVLAALHKAYPDADCALHWTNPLELLVATILSAQTTDAHVNEVTPAVFKKYPTARHYADASLEELQEDLKSIGLFRNKSKFIKAACQVLVEKHGGEVPQTMEELLELPGVARKTANVVLGVAFGVPSGIVVDTHVDRLVKRLGFVKPTEKNRDKIERTLMELTPQEDWIFLGHALILHGRRVCPARKPACDACELAKWCPRQGVKG